MSYERPTAKDVERVLEAYREVLDRAPWQMIRPGARLVLEQGSKTYGRAWRLYETGHVDHTGEVTTGYYRPTIGDDFLGMTAREARAALSTRLRVVADVVLAMLEEGGDR